MQSKKISHCSWVILGCVVLFLTSCKNDKKLSEKDAQGLSEDFVTFYNRFHNDKAYQLAHIQFPLEGLPSGNLSDSVKNVSDFRWTSDKWVMQSLAQFNDSLYIREFEQPMPIMVNEIIIEKKSKYGIMRRFLKRDNEWMLIFYSDMNRLENK